jgi:hypothetical protein
LPPLAALAAKSARVNADPSRLWPAPIFLRAITTSRRTFCINCGRSRSFSIRPGCPLPKLLAFWAEISTVGQKSLYTKLFLTHNLVAIDSVFQADANGNYLTKQPPEKITGHIPVLMAALKLKAEDIGAFGGHRTQSPCRTYRT